MRGNFDYFEDEDALKAVQQAATRIHRKYSYYIDREDLVQEGHFHLATKSDLQQSFEEKEYGLLQYGLERDLEHVCLKLARRSGRDISFSDHEEELGGRTTAIADRMFSDLTESGFRGGHVPEEHPAAWDLVNA